MGEQMEDLTVETGWNLAQNHWVRYNTFHGNFWHNYWLSVEGFRFNRWCDNNPVYDDYIGHPMMGAISMDIFIQNDPRGMSLELENSRAYWHSRLRALLWASRLQRGMEGGSGERSVVRRNRPGPLFR